MEIVPCGDVSSTCMSPLLPPVVNVRVAITCSRKWMSLPPYKNVIVKGLSAVAVLYMEKKTLQLVNFHFVTSLSLANHVFVPTICMGNRLEKKLCILT